jgi:hypothetical protein
MAGTGYHPEGHKLRPYEGKFFCPDPLHGHMICANCATVCPLPEDECVDDC